MPRLLVTRPAAEAEALCRQLDARGFATDAAPLLQIIPRQDAGPALAAALDGVRHLLVTSANGLRAFAALSPRRDLQVLAVGPASADAAAQAGFADVAAAGGDVDALAALVRARLSPATAGPLLHAAGTTLAGDLAAMLRADGFELRRVALYDAVPAAALPADMAARFGAGAYAAALFFSPRTAATFVTLAGAAGIAGGAAATRALCLSANVAAAVAPLPWRGVATATEPSEAALLALLPEPTAV